jgi:1,4-alpha-glucan branching enzyme
VLDAAPDRVTLSITPVLADQLEAPGVLERCLRFLREVRPASHRLDLEAGPEPAVAAELERSAARYAAAAGALERRGDLLHAFAPHVSWTSAATHAVLPLLATDAGVRLQLETGIASHRARFGAWHGGFWLPECAHAPWLDELLEESGVHAACVDWTDVLGGLAGSRRPPQRSEAGVLLVPLDREAIDLVWHERGYPAHGDYRDSHRLTPRAHRPWANDGTPYDPERGAARAREHARDFVARVRDREHCVVAFDTELFGHFWHEGVTWLAAVLEAAEIAGLPVVALDDALREAGETRPAPLASPTSWGEGRDLRTWSAPAAGGLAWAQRSAELAALGARPSARALRELLALQSSDWAFLISRGTAADYPRERAEGHRAAFAAALAGAADPALRGLAPQLADWAFVQP